MLEGFVVASEASWGCLPPAEVHYFRCGLFHSKIIILHVEGPYVGSRMFLWPNRYPFLFPSSALSSFLIYQLLNSLLRSYTSKGWMWKLHFLFPFWPLHLPHEDDILYTSTNIFRGQFESITFTLRAFNRCFYPTQNQRCKQTALQLR